MSAVGYGQIEVRGDSDWFRAHFEAGHIYQISVALGDVRLGLSLPDGTAFSPPVAYSNQITFIAPVSGDYWISATGFSDHTNYILNSAEVSDPNPPSIASTLTLDVGQTISGGGGDYRVDSDRWYAVQLQAGQSYFFQSSILTSTLYLNDANGNLISIGSDQYHFTPTASGTYYLGTHGFSNSFYSLSLEVVADDHGESPSAAGSLSTDTPASGVWETGGDSDWYGITLTAGTSYNFALSTSSDWHPGSITIYDAAGDAIGGIGSGYAHTSYIFSPAETGTYYVSAGTGSDYYNPLGGWTYTLTATTVRGDLASNQLTAGTLTLGTTADGNWEGLGDVDWYAVSLTAGQSYGFQVNSNVGGVEIALYDSAGNEVLRPEGGFSDTFGRLAQTVGTTGTYYIAVSARDLPFPATYTLTGSSFVDDFANNSATTGRITVGGTASGAFEVDGDRDWFAVQFNAGTSYALTSPDGMPEAIRDAQGNLLTEFNWGDQHFSPLVSGTYYLEVVGNVGTYTAGISEVFDDYREDTLSSGVMRQEVDGTSGNDTFVSTANYEAFDGSAGDDRFVASDGYDLYVGGSGIDTVSFGQFSVGVNVNLRLGGTFENGVRKIEIYGMENVEGSNFADVIEGSKLDNILTGEAGADTLTGGSGNDTFSDTAAGLNGDTITDFSAGDKVVISDANVANFSFSLSGNTLTYTGGSLTLTSVPAGHIVASAATAGGVQLAIQTHDPDNDFNGDGKSDLLWRSDGGEFSDWLGTASGGFASNDANAFANLPTSWKVAGTGDFNGDGRDDVLWLSDAGQLSDWLGTANGGFAVNDANAFTSDIGTPASSWHVVGVGDFNGDGRDDVLWRADSGAIYNWLGQANGGFSSNDVNSFVSVPTNWKVASVGDFNGDGKDDILWRSDSGQLSDWLGTATGGYSNNDANAFTNVPTSWHVVGTGDFNGDGQDDILWRSGSGQLSDWLGQANGGFAVNDANALVSIPTSWHVADTGDYNGDGRDDILWRSDAGDLSDWLGQANGGFVANDANAFTTVSTSWHAQSPNSLWV